MSLHKTPLTTILEINPHPNADRLSLATCYGFQVVIKKDFYNVGDKVVFIPVDSILPDWLEKQLFPEGSKVTLNHSRVRQIRLRGYPSQGMLIHPRDLDSKLGKNWETKVDLETDLSEKLGVTKYEPQFKEKGPQGEKKRNKPLENSRFHQYKGVENLKWFPNLFKEGEEVVVQEKLHGSNVRCSIQLNEANTFMKKIKKVFGLLPKYEKCYGSNMVQLQNRPGHTGYYGSDVYGAVLQKVSAFSKLKEGETIFGELIGPGIQKGYDYGHTEHHFVLFDVKVTLEDGRQEYLNPDDVEAYAKERGFDFVPVLYKGPFNKTEMEKLCTGPSVYHPEEKVREGVVIKAKLNYGENSSKKALKVINPEYLDNQSNTDFH